MQLAIDLNVVPVTCEKGTSIFWHSSRNYGQIWILCMEAPKLDIKAIKDFPFSLWNRTSCLSGGHENESSSVFPSLETLTYPFPLLISTINLVVVRRLGMNSWLGWLCYENRSPRKGWSHIPQPVLPSPNVTNVKVTFIKIFNFSIIQVYVLHDVRFSVETSWSEVNCSSST